jgi:hypothetical protein
MSNNCTLAYLGCNGTVRTLPEGEEDDGLDGEELDDRVEGSEQVPRGEVEQEQGVQSHRNAAQQ